MTVEQILSKVLAAISAVNLGQTYISLIVSKKKFHKTCRNSNSMSYFFKKFSQAYYCRSHKGLDPESLHDTATTSNHWVLILRFPDDIFNNNHRGFFPFHCGKAWVSLK